MAKLKERYANALFELAVENGTLETDLEQAILVRDTINNTDLERFLAHPHIPNAVKQQLFQNTFSGKISDQLMGFLDLMVRKNREALIVPALTEYIDRIRRYFGRSEAKVVSAKALSAKQIEAIRAILARKIKGQVELEAYVDPALIGGFYILVDGRIFDCTVRSDLHMMREHLKRGGCA